MQLNEALFSGTNGFVLKPAALRADGDGDIFSSSEGNKVAVLKLKVAGASGVPLPGDKTPKDVKPYFTCSLVYPGGKTKRKTAAVKFTGQEVEKTVNPFWNDTLEWEFPDNELAFLRMFVKSDDSFSSNPILAVAALRLLYVVKGEWVVVPMLDLKGHRTGCSVVVKFDVEKK